MCGIIAYTGYREAHPILLDGLRRLEYRGYDSAGLATSTGNVLHVRKRAGRIDDLAELLDRLPVPGCHGIGHTRWATHGGATDANAHPHLGGRGDVALVHNGVIENHAVLRHELQQLGYVFQSNTDTEVIAHLVAHYLDGDLPGAVARAVARLHGTYALAVISPRNPGMIVGACLGSPLTLGIGRGENFLASDAGALAGQVDEVVYVRDQQLCVLRPDGWQIYNGSGGLVRPSIHLAPQNRGERSKRKFDHFMHKEIHEQPRILETVLHGRLDDFGLKHSLLREASRVIMTGCGTSYHAALLGKYLFEELVQLPVEVEYASEFRYRHPPVVPGSVVLAISQSGETADTLAAVREARRRGQPTLALCNEPGSSLARLADETVPLRAGPEIGVASTKAFTAQVAVLAALALSLGRARHPVGLEEAYLTRELCDIPHHMARVLECEERVRDISRKYAQVRNMLYLGRSFLYPVALEGALKLKEVSYVHAEGYPAAEMKHGPIALVDEDTPSVFLISRSAVYDKVMSNLEEIRARGGPIIAVATEGDEEVAARADDVIDVPRVPDCLQPLVDVVPLQLLAYHTALLRGCDVDKPRHLAKSVTVE